MGNTKRIILIAANLVSAELLAKAIKEKPAAAAEEILIVIGEGEAATKLTESLQEELNIANSRLLQFQDQVNKLNTSLETLQEEKDQVDSQIITLKHKLRLSEEENETLANANSELMVELSKFDGAAPGAKEETFNFEGKTYRFVMPAVMHKGSRKTIADVLDDSSLQEHLVKRRSGMIIEK